GDVVEEGPAAQVLAHPQHEYTARLLAAVPDLPGHKDLTLATGSVTQVREALAKGTAEQAGEPAASDASAERAGQDGFLLEVSGLGMRYGSNTVLDGIDMTLQPGESLMLLGESGSGKTTLSRCIAGLIDGYTGSVQLRGEELANSTRKRSLAHRQEIQYVFQSPFSSLNPRRTIGESLSVPLEMSGRLPRSQHRETVEDALDAVRLGRSFYDRRPGDLSGG